VNPQPLIRVAPHVILNNLREQSGVGDHVAFFILRTNQLDRGLKSKPVFPQDWIPHRETRNHGGIRSQRNPRQAARGASWYSEKVYEYSLGRRHIRIHQYTHGLARLHGRQ
jgi:hypothetical protein